MKRILFLVISMFICVAAHSEEQLVLSNVFNGYDSAPPEGFKPCTTKSWYCLVTFDLTNNSSKELTVTMVSSIQSLDKKYERYGFGQAEDQVVIPPKTHKQYAVNVEVIVPEQFKELKIDLMPSVRIHNAVDQNGKRYFTQSKENKA